MTVGIASLLTGLACLVNPYGLAGALYPLQLAGTMSNPIFSQNIAELTPIPEFIKRDVFLILPFRLHLATIALAVLSFLVPMVWVAFQKESGGQCRCPSNRPDRSHETVAEGTGKTRKSAARAVESEPEIRPAAWRPSIFRLLLYVAFCYLSWQATRNSHQFAAGVGSLTAWNFAEWAAADRRPRRQRQIQRPYRRGRGVAPRVVALARDRRALLWVASGRFYEASREGRTIGLGEEPLWYPHEAVKFSGGPGMPERFLGYHMGHASLYEYYFAPERKVFADARLEVIGPDLFERYMTLERRITKLRRRPAWGRELDAAGRPVVLVDLANDISAAAGMLASRSWRCVWFDPIAAVFVHESYGKIVSTHEVDFLARHFHPDPAFEPTGTAGLLAMTKNLGNLAGALAKKASRSVRPIVLLGLDLRVAGSRR